MGSVPVSIWNHLSSCDFPGVGWGSGPQFLAKVVDPSEAYFYCWFIGLRAGCFILLYHCFKLRVFAFVSYCQIVSLVCDVFLCFCHFPIWCLGSGVVLDCIDS